MVELDQVMTRLAAAEAVCAALCRGDLTVAGAALEVWREQARQTAGGVPVGTNGAPPAPSPAVPLTARDAARMLGQLDDDEEEVPFP